jgi:hypothetical protein
MSHGSDNYTRGFIWMFLSMVTVFSATMWDNLDNIFTVINPDTNTVLPAVL